MLQADGGTRPSKVQVHLAMRIAVNKLLEEEKNQREDQVIDNLAAISAGVYENNCILDLDYPEDRDATWMNQTVVFMEKANLLKFNRLWRSHTRSRI